MPRMIFVNLPVADLDRSIGFYRALGAAQNMQFSDETAAMMSFSAEVNVMLLTHDKYSQFTSKAIADAHASSQVLLCLSADGRDEVDAMVAAAAAAGGVADPAPKQEYSFCYGRDFEDPDGTNGSDVDDMAALAKHAPRPRQRGLRPKFDD